MKKLFSLLLVLTMVFQCLPFQVVAENADKWQGVKSDPMQRSGNAIHIVTWIVNDETGSKTIEGEDVLLSSILPSSPSREGDFRFTGWLDQATGEMLEDLHVRITSDFTLEAQFEAVHYAYLTFRSEGSEDQTVRVEEGKAIGNQMPAAPVHAGRRFDGWFDGDQEITSATIAAGDRTIMARFTEMVEIDFDPNDPDEQQPGLKQIVLEVPRGEAIGNRLPAVPEKAGYRGIWVMENTAQQITADTEVTEAFHAVLNYDDKIEYTVTFVQADGTTDTRTTSVDAGFAVNQLPEVAPRTNQVGRWVYPGTGSEFTVGTVISEDLTVHASYEQNIFTVQYMVDQAEYEQMTAARGIRIILPSDPIRKGATFSGWFTEPDGQGTQYTEESTVSRDLTLYAYFTDQVRVSFTVKDPDGNVISEKSQYFVDLAAGDAITTLPDDPFIEGDEFDHWENETTGETVEIGYKVTESFHAVAVFKQINAYTLTLKYYYMDGSSRKDIQSQVYELTEHDFPYTVTTPGYTVVLSVAGAEDQYYYPEQPTVTVTADQFANQQLTSEVRYVPANAGYQVGHYLKSLDGKGYELIEKLNKEGVKNSVVTPEINNYAYADYEKRDENVTLTGQAGQELKVYYTRRDYTLSYNVAGGDYVKAATAPYGSRITLPSTAARAGYTFAGWYTDEACTVRASSPVTLTDNTTLFAKWNAAQSGYKIVYMIENANDADYSYLATATKTAATGSSVTMTAQTAGANGTKPSELDTVNFTFRDSTTETVKADGTTVVTVRYSRNVYTLQGRTGTGWNASNISGASVTAKYASDITQAWSNQFNSHSGSWSYNNQNNSKFKSLTIMPSLSVRSSGSGNTIYVFNHNDTANYYEHLEYWLQNYESDAVTTHNGKTYGRVKSVDMRYNYLSNVDDWYEIAGYTKAGYTADHRKNETSSWQSFTYSWGKSFSQYGSQYTYTRFNFYYDAKPYPLTFYNYDGTLISDQDVTLGDDISVYLTRSIPSAPMEGAVWKGWFTDEKHTSPYSGGKRMPEGLVLYGSFAFPDRTVTFDAQGGSVVKAQTDEYGFYADMPASPAWENHTFQGWFTSPDDTGSPYDWNQPVTQNITLYARWTQKTIGYTVHYYEKDSTSKVMPDKVITNPALLEGQAITEEAPTVARMVSDRASATLKLSFNESENVITFYYTEIPQELSYTVKYVLKDHPEIQVAPPRTRTVDGSTTNVLEKAVAVDAAYLAEQTSDPEILSRHYQPAESAKEQQLALDGNVITFEYISLTTARMTVCYLDMDGNSIHDADVSYVEKGDTFTVEDKAPHGYVYHHAYLDGTETEARRTYQIDGSEGDLVINLYYQKKLIILAAHKAKTYDGTALTSSFEEGDYTVTGNMRGDVLKSLAFEGSQTEAGTSSTTPMHAVIEKGGQAISDPEDYYSIVYVPGSLTVKPASVYISVNADQWETHSGGTGGANYYTGNVFDAGFTNPAKQRFNDAAGSAYIHITSGQRALFMETYGDAIWNALYGENGALISEKDAGEYKVTGAQQTAMIAGVSVNGKRMMSDPNYSIQLFARDCILNIEPLPVSVQTGSAERV